MFLEEREMNEPAKVSRSVDFPEPEGPIIAMILPGSANPLRPFSNLFVGALFEKFGSTTLRSSHSKYAPLPLPPPPPPPLAASISISDSLWSMMSQLKEGSEDLTQKRKDKWESEVKEENLETCLCSVVGAPSQAHSH